MRGVVRQKWGQLTWLKLFSLLQHLGLVGATGPHSGSRGEHGSPLVHTGERARREAHGRACGSIALRPRSRPNPFPNPPGTIPFQKAGDVHVVPAAASST